MNVRSSVPNVAGPTTSRSLGFAGTETIRIGCPGLFNRYNPDAAFTAVTFVSFVSPLVNGTPNSDMSRTRTSSVVRPLANCPSCELGMFGAVATEKSLATIA